MVLNKTLESPLDCKEIQPVHSEGDQPWDFFGRIDGVITDLEPDMLECEVKWALESITTNKASGGDGIPVSSFKS